ncbi:hypothetical protein EV189_1827 [Motilibacter rhizosphaerae]|uniref:Reprolysin-like metallo-peptidase family M12B n=1 Tax=Motilibacter rhizosphaerae TaxID=598652 RepID=A0A4Q7NST7_9ACTN|nr:hypothetical protein [Motilibacter rhizosphaerae]RZS90044.1 hypothetical protein EV189_1827 [Motilibacter rhizosphaerae]
MSSIARRAAAAAATGLTGAVALAVTLTGVPSALGATTGTASLGALRASTEVAVAAHGVNKEGYEGDEAPAGVDVHQEVSTAQLVEAADSVQDPAATGTSGTRTGIGCSGDGTSGNRVQAVYVGVAGQNDRYDAVVGALRAYTAGVDGVYLASAMEHGGRRQIRWVHDSSCQVVVDHVVLNPSDVASFGAERSALVAKGYDRGDRKYLLYTDAAVLCGVANVFTDTSPLQSNANNGGYAQYARVDAPCWAPQDHSVEAHELTHTLGAVLSFAPHATANGHCTDESDVMCYVDGSGVVMTQSCPTTHEKLLDCGGDDYFNTNPAPGSALATNWNAANSSFLFDPPAPTATLSYDGSAAVLAPSVPSGQGWRVDWTAPGCTPATATTTSPGGARLAVSCPSGGTVTATLTQQDGRTAQASTAASASGTPAPASSAAPTPTPGATANPGPSVAPTAPATTPVATLALGLTTVTPKTVAGTRVVLTGTATTGTAPAAGTRVALQRKQGTGWTTLGWARTSAQGTVSLTVAPVATTAYRLAAGTTTSAALTVTVTPKVQVSASGLTVKGAVRPAAKGTRVALVQHGRAVATTRTDAAGRFVLTAPRSGSGYAVTVAAQPIAQLALSAR